MSADKAAPPGEAERALARYSELLLERSAKLNLTAARSYAAIAEHVADSLTLLPYVRAPLIDIGSGGGFPAIPLAIMTAVPTTLIEAAAKKAQFLETVVALLGLKAQVIASRAEEAGRRSGLRERFACATARGVGPLTTVLELTLPFLQIGGIAVLQRGHPGKGEAQNSREAALALGAELIGEERISGTAARRVVLVRKVCATAERFPRRAGMPAKRPLGEALHASPN